MVNVLTVKDVTTELSGERLIHGVSLTIPAGSITALVGHNGAGKSTLIKTIMGITEKTTGEIILTETIDQDESFLAFKQLISYLPEEPLLLTELTVMQHFQLYAMSYQLSEATLKERVERYVAGFELTDKLDEYPESLSKGMRQKVQTICALLPDVPVLLIDEPFMGLDIYAMDYLEQVIAEKLAAGTGILLTTHQLERVRDLADQYVLLQHGELVSHGPMATFESITRRTEI